VDGAPVCDRLTARPWQLGLRFGCPSFIKGGLSPKAGCKSNAAGFQRAIFMKGVEFIEETRVLLPLDKGGIESLREEITPALTPALSPSRGGIAGRRNAGRGVQYSNARRPKLANRAVTAVSRVKARPKGCEIRVALGFPTRRSFPDRTRPTAARPADWEIGDPAGWETCGTGLQAAPMLRLLLWHAPPVRRGFIP
jgi:hypothetical protein